MNNEKIDIFVLIFDFLRILRKMWIRVVALTTIFAIIMTVNANFKYHPYYTAYSSFTVTTVDEQNYENYTAFYDNAAAEQMAETFPYILTSGVLQRKVANDMGTGISGSISARVLPNTNIFTLSVTDSDPARAHKTLKYVIKNYPSVAEVIFGKLNMKVLDESGVPTQPNNYKDLKGAAAKGGVMGLGLGLAWVAVVTLFRKTIRSEEDCQKRVNQRCLGTVPYVKIKERSDKTKRHINITRLNANPNFKEAIRNIRNKIERYASSEDKKRILLTSALSGEGKSTLAVNIAISLAQEGKKVTLVDCDLRNPSGAEILNFNAEKGLVDYLKGNAEFKECIYQSSKLKETNEAFKFYFIPGGKPVADASNLLGSDKMREVIDIVSDNSDYVILDSAPVGLLTDASVLSQYADGAIFVVKKDFAKTEHIMSGIQHLSNSNIPVFGCILNGD